MPTSPAKRMRRVTDGNRRVSAAGPTATRSRTRASIAERLAGLSGSRATKCWGSILEGSIKDAVAYDMTQGVPLFEGVRQDLEETQRLYDDQASQRLANVAALATRTVIATGDRALCTVLLGRAFLCGSCRKSKMTSTFAWQGCRWILRLRSRTNCGRRWPFCVPRSTISQTEL